MTLLNFNILINYYQKISLYLIYLLPVALITGPFLPDLFLSLIGLFFLLISIKNKLWSYYKNPFVYFFTVFYFFILIRSLFSENIYFSLSGSLFYFRYLFFSLSIFYFCNIAPQFIKKLGISLFFSILFVALDSYLQWITGKNIFGWSTNDPYRLSSFFGDELIVGGYLARLTPVCLALLLMSIKITKLKLFIGLFFLILIDVVVFGSGERAAFFFITLYTILIIVLSNKYQAYRLFTFILSAIIIALITFYDPTSNEKVKDTINEVTNNNTVPLAPYTPHHEEHYIVGLKMFLDNPFFGQAPKMFRQLCNEDKFAYKGGCATHPHNTYIELLSETGIIGASFLIFLFLMVTFILFKQFLAVYFNIYPKIPDYLVLLLSAIFIMTWPLVPTGSFFNNWTNVMYYLPVGFLLNYFFKKKVKS